MRSSPSAVARASHTVGFYADDAALVAELVPWARAGFDAGEAVLVVASAERCRLLDSGLLATGTDVEGLRAAGRYETMEASALLELILTADRCLARDRFHAEVGRSVEHLARDGQRLRVYGEMVSLLWAEGAALTVLELEDAWNELLVTQPLTVHCGYDTDPSGPERDLDVVHQICSRHVALTTPDWSTVPAAIPDGTVGAVFLASAVAPRAARRFARSVVQSWDLGSAADIVELVVSELATNAVRHAESPFEVSLERVEGRIVVRVRDRSRALPEHRPLDPESPDGRGITICEALADAYSVEVTGGGKIVTVEIAA